MASIPSADLLSKVQDTINVDVDSLDTDFIKSLPITPDDQTSNPAWLFVQLQSPSSKELVTQILKSDERLRQSGDAGLLLARTAVLLCKKNIPLINGRVLVQTSPSAAYDYQATLAHARTYAREFERANISRDRYCIKIIATGPGLNAAKLLSKEGIPILGTAVFSVEQAIACFQAGCLYISPYYNGIKELQESSLLPNVQDVATQHPFSPRLIQMVQAFKELHRMTGQNPPLIKNAGFGSIQEVLASIEIGCHSVTISAPTLQMMLDPSQATLKLPEGSPTKLSRLERPYAANVPIPAPRLDGISGGEPDQLFSSQLTRILQKDFLASDGKALEQSIETDHLAQERVNDAMAFFKMAEQGSLQLMRSFFSNQVGLSSL